jgi:hypothetical protein
LLNELNDWELKMKLKLMLASLLCSSALIMGPAVAEQPEKRFSGTVEINSTQLAFIISGRGGGGVLEFNGQEYYFDIKGLGVGGFGVSTLNAVGAVYNLEKVDDFNGVYVQARAGAAVGPKGKGYLSIGNSKGVILELKGGQQGLALMTGVDGLKIKLRQ